jgi:hypothetical protein
MVAESFTKGLADGATEVHKTAWAKQNPRGVTLRRTTAPFNASSKVSDAVAGTEGD